MALTNDMHGDRGNGMDWGKKSKCPHQACSVCSVCSVCSYLIVQAIPRVAVDERPDLEQMIEATQQLISAKVFRLSFYLSFLFFFSQCDLQDATIR